MKRGLRNFLFGFTILSLIALTIATNAGADTPWSQSGEPPPPTPGPPPTSVPYEPKGGQPVLTEDEAIQRALAIDSDWTVRAEPLTDQLISATPDMIIVESYSTMQEAEGKYLGSGSGVPEIAAEPVWVVRIKGKALWQPVGGGFARGLNSEEQLYEEADGATYIFSQATGFLLAFSPSDLPREESLRRWRESQTTED